MPSMMLAHREQTMNVIRRILTRTNRGGGTCFDRYYGGVIRSGSGYPTADEARRDLTTYDRNSVPFGWPR